MTAWREPAPTKDPPREARCKGCGEWLATAPGCTKWVRARCGNKRCRLYGAGQTIHLK